MPNHKCDISHRVTTILRAALMLVLLVLFISCLTACGTDKVAYLKYVDMHGWKKIQPVEFDLRCVDSLPDHSVASRYDMVLQVRINDIYDYTTLPVLVSIESPDGYSRSDTIIISVESPTQRKRSVSGLSSVSYPLATDFALPRACRVTVSQISGDYILPVNAVGLLLEKKER